MGNGDVDDENSDDDEYNDDDDGDVLDHCHDDHHDNSSCNVATLECSKYSNAVSTCNVIDHTGHIFYESLLASQSDAHRIAPHRDFHPTHTHPLIAQTQERPMM